MITVRRRGLSFFLVGAVYVLTAGLGIWLYHLIPGAAWLKLLGADVGATVCCFLFSLLFKNASVYDPYWSVQPMVILPALAVGRALSTYQILLIAAVCLWGLRLTANWAYTFHGLTSEDWRYRMLREKTGIFYPLINFIGIHMVPTLVVWGCTLPGATVLWDGAKGDLLSCIPLLLCLLAVILQGTADVQMHRFRKAGTGGFIRVGLWKHSRHPNYLGEILMWWGVGLSCCLALEGKWCLLAGAMANTLLFFCVSIPMADGRQSKKPGFAQYKKETRMLLPIQKLRRT